MNLIDCNIIFHIIVNSTTILKLLFHTSAQRDLIDLLR